MTRILVLPILLLAFHPFHASIGPLSKPVRTKLTGRFWHVGCPVSLSRLRVLTVSDWGFDGRVHEGQLIVNRDATAPLTKVFRRLFELHFSIRYMRLADAYGPQRSGSADGDIRVVVPLYPRHDPVADYVTLDEGLAQGLRISLGQWRRRTFREWNELRFESPTRGPSYVSRSCLRAPLGRPSPT